MRGVKLSVIAAALAALLAPAAAQQLRAPDKTLGMALLSARVAADGTLEGGAGVVSSQRNSAGNYGVTFNRDVSSCDLSASVSNNDNILTPGYISVTLSSVVPGATFVATGSVASFNEDRAFTVLVFCVR